MITTLFPEMYMSMSKEILKIINIRFDGFVSETSKKLWTLLLHNDYYNYKETHQSITTTTTLPSTKTKKKRKKEIIY